MYVDAEFKWAKYYCELLKRGAVASDLREAVWRKVKELESGKLNGKSSSSLLSVVINLRQKAFTEELRDNSNLYELANSTQSLPALILVPDRPPESKVRASQKVFCSVWYPDNEPAADPFLVFVTVLPTQRKDTIRDVLRRVMEHSAFAKPKLYEGKTHRNFAKEVDVTRGDALMESEDGWVHRYADGLPVIVEVQRPRSSKQALVLRDSEQV